MYVVYTYTRRRRRRYCIRKVDKHLNRIFVSACGGVGTDDVQTAGELIKRQQQNR